MTLNQHLATRVLVFTLLLLILLFATGALLAQIQTQSGDRVEATDVLPDMAFFAAGDLEVTAKSTDDIFAAGGEVTITGAQADHMLVAGGEITITDVAFQDLITAGGDVDFISGSVTDDIVTAGGDLTIKPEFNIGGSLVITGGDVDINAPVGGELRAAAARLRLNANVEGDAHLIGEEVTIEPGVRIGGDLRHRAQKITIAPSAVVAGEIIELEPATPPDVEKWGMKAGAALAVFALAFIAGFGILVIVIALILPSLMNSSAAMIREKPFSTLGIGFLIVIAAPLLIGLLLATVLGIPLAMLIGVIYLAAAPVAIAAFVYFAGMTGRRTMSKEAGDSPEFGARFLWSALAAIVLVLVGLIPFIGGFFWIMAYVLGMGAVMTRGGKALAIKA